MTPVLKDSIAAAGKAVARDLYVARQHARLTQLQLAKKLKISVYQVRRREKLGHVTEVEVVRWLRACGIPW